MIAWTAIKLFLGPIFSGIGSFISAAFTFLTTAPGVYILMAGIAVGAYWYSGHEGYKHGAVDTVAAQKLEEAVAVQAAYKIGIKNQADLDKSEAADAYTFGVAEGKATAKTVTLTKEIPTYVTIETDGKFAVPCGLFRVWRAAESGDGADPSTISLPPGLTDADACPIAASDLADNIVAVTGLYHVAEAQIIGLQALAHTLVDAVSK